MARAGYIYGQGTPWTYEQIQQNRRIADAMRSQMGTPRNLGEGLAAIGKALAIRGIDRRAAADEAGQKADWNAKYGGILQALGSGRAATGGGTLPGTTYQTPDPVAPLVTKRERQSAAERMGRGDITAEALRQGYLDRGLPPAQVDGMLMNIRDESGYNPAAVGDGGMSGGLTQLHGPRFEALKAYAASVGKPWQDTATQMDFHVQELKDPAYARFMAATTPGEAGVAFLNDYERPAEQYRAQREAAYRGAAGPLGGGSQPGAPGATPAPAMASTGGMDIQTLAEIMNSPWATDGQKMMARVYLDRMMKEPETQYRILSDAEERAMGLDPTGTYQVGANNQVSVLTAPRAGGADRKTATDQNGVLRYLDTGEPAFPGVTAGPEPEPEAIRSLRIRAQEAGLQPGTPEYNTFMLNAGKADGMAIEIGPDNQVRVTQGAAAAGAAGKPFTEAQGKDVGFATRAEGALPSIDQYGNALTGRKDVALDYIPFGLGASYQSEDYQVAKQAGQEFLQAILRKDTGAAITPGEQSLYGETYLPLPGDGPRVLAAKKLSRLRALEALKAGMSPSQMIAQEKALGAVDAARAADGSGGGSGSAPTETVTVNGQQVSKEAFVSSPDVQKAAADAGTTPEAMWEMLKQDGGN